MPFTIAISGGSGSGKTTIAEKLAQMFAAKSVLLSEDGYYKNFFAIPGFDALTYDFDDIEARDLDLMIAQIKALKAGKAVEAPVYCFVRHGRKDETETIAPADLIIFEGIHLLHDARVRNLFDLKIYVDAPDDVRLIRRLARDTKPESEGGRGRAWAQVIDQYVNTVRPSHLKFTEPGRTHADIVLNNHSVSAKAPDENELTELLQSILDHKKFKMVGKI